MKIADTDILILAGLQNSGPGHWQRRWQDKMSTAQWVEQEDWNNPSREDWVEQLTRAIMMATRPVVLVGHSLGVPTIVHTAARLTDTKVRGAFLATPPDLDGNAKVSEEILDFANVPRDPLPFPSLLIASTNDEVCSVEAAAVMANCWGSEFHVAGDVGHLNAASGHGPWPEGLMMFTRLMQRLKA